MTKRLSTALLSLTLLFLTACAPSGQLRDSPTGHSVARLWNEALLHAIRDDFARPPVHARNLFHTSVAMYDAWAAFDDSADTYLLGKTRNGFSCPFEPVEALPRTRAAQEEAISYAAYRVLVHRFLNSPGALATQLRFGDLMRGLGYNGNWDRTDYSRGSPAALGNYIAQCVIAYGLEDGSNEAKAYAPRAYAPVNPALDPTEPGNPQMVHLNRWQPLAFSNFIDQSGNVLGPMTPEFIGPEWGSVAPFALSAEDLSVRQRGGVDYWLYHDPGPPPYLNAVFQDSGSAEYQWNFALVLAWAAHLDPSDGVMWDISPGSMGNLQNLPQSWEDYRRFYDFSNGGDTGGGHPINPHTGAPYAPNRVPRGDYTRVLAEFWADGPDSETPPGHWYVILNYVSDQPQLEKRLGGQGPVLDDLEWDIKSYFALGGAMHDAAVSAWGIKGWYDYVRPVSAIRAMAELGQSSDPGQPNYHPSGLPLVEGLIELVMPGDPLLGENNQHLHKLKVWSWRGPDYIPDPTSTDAGVDWILVENWWPYQRPSFITPPFAGYVSGHSTYSRAAAEVLTLLTGDAYFPGGMGEFAAPRNNFLVFEQGPSVDVTLQWATYRDAADQCSLSRIWGGIHPPVDDIPGRRIGEQVGIDAFELATRYFNNRVNDGE